MIRTLNNMTLKIKPSLEIQNKITLWLNHLLVVYAFLIPIHNKSKTSVFFVMLILFIVRMDYAKYLKDTFSNKVVQAFLLFYLLWWFGFLYSENLEWANDSIKKAKFLVFPLLFLSFLDKRFSYRIVSAFILGMLVSELFSYAIRFEFLPPELFFAGHEVYITHISDPSPFFNHLDHNIGLAIVVALLLYQLLNKKLSLLLKLLSVLFIMSATINMTFIGSRTGYVLYLFLIGVVLLITYKKDLKKAIFLFLLVLISVVPLAYNYSNMIHDRVNATMTSFNEILENENYHTSIGIRLGFIKYSLEVIEENILFGVGTGDYMDELRAVIPSKHDYIKEYSQPHNVYIKTLLQFGLIGLFFLFFLFYRLFTYKDASEYDKGIIIILTSAVILFMLPGKFYGYFVLPMFVTLISTMIVHKEKSIEYKKVDFISIFQYTIFTLLFLIIGITK